MKTLTRALFVVLLLSSAVTANAATCRSGEAAVRGGEAGLARDQDAADTTQTAAQTSSDILGKCVGGSLAFSAQPRSPICRPSGR